ncbi:MAG: decaprenyl-phosphate phosphoribosyltransferase [Acidobacteria bacterium]|nr:MAG: decaprenyl-phosphate phosphoribosyltransferase [Acidobacteriota bacterium]
MSTAKALLQAARPRQWPKNLLVLAAPAAAGVLLDHIAVLAGAALLFVVASAGVYLINDAVDVEADRRHERKKERPVASGALPVSVALGAGAVALAAPVIAAAVLMRDARFATAIGAYAGISVAYSLWLKRIVVIDMLAVASGFIIRSVAGGILIDIPISKWFVIVVSFGSLFIVAGKRYSQHAGKDTGHQRISLEAYTSRYLGDVRSISAAVTLLGYCLWAFERAEGARGGIWIELSIIPFLAIILRYALIVEDGAGEFPEEALMGDRFVIVSSVVLAALLAMGIHAA